MNDMNCRTTIFLKGGSKFEVDTRSVIAFEENLSGPARYEKGLKSTASYNLVLLAHGGVYIGRQVNIGPNVTITTVKHDETEHEKAVTAPIRICDNVIIYAGAIICPGVTIGKNAIVGAGSVVLHDVPPNSFVAGNPAKLIRMISVKPVATPASEVKEMLNDQFGTFREVSNDYKKDAPTDGWNWENHGTNLKAPPLPEEPVEEETSTKETKK